jgi:dipeptidase D
MMKILKDLQPADLFKYFEEISSIPRGSGNEQAISNYMIHFASELGLWAKQDEAYNVYIKKPASPGYENAPVVILQGHLDMVCEKNKDTSHDFEKDGLNLCIDGDYIHAKGTTLGADNGVAIAYQMAVLADKTLKHPAIEVLMTTDEERGMTGVSCVHPEYLEGKIVINLDTDVEGEFLVSCAGGIKAYIDLKLDYEPTISKQTAYRIIIKGLLGGHSGADIHLERANAHILMGRALSTLRKHMSFNLCDISGGTKDNVIARECESVIVCNSSDAYRMQSLIEEIQDLFQNEYRMQDSGVNITCCKESLPDKALTKELTQDIIDLLILMPNGVISFDQSMKGLVETSLNLGILEMQENHLRFGSAIRSSISSKKLILAEKLEVLSNRFNGAFKVKGDYPAWEYSQHSQLRDLAVRIYKEMYTKEPEIKSIHAGLECGYLSQKLLGVDIIAFGPEVKDIHSPNERVSISSMARVYEYLIRLLESIVTY